MKSAIKDLAQLLSRLDRTEESLDLLEAERGKFSPADRVSVLNMTAHFNAKLGKYLEAAQIYKEISRHHSDPKRRSTVLKQSAHALYYGGKFKEALQELEFIQPLIARDDNQYLELLALVREALKTGVIAKSDAAFMTLSRELQLTEMGPISKTAIGSCRFEMVDERSRERGYFGEDDIKALNSTFSRRGGERPALKAQIALNLTAIYHSSDSLFDEEEARKNLVRFLTLSAEAAYSSGDIDVVLSYLQEAFVVASGKKDSNDEAKITEWYWRRFSNQNLTPLSSSVSPAKRFSPRGRKSTTC